MKKAMSLLLAVICAIALAGCWGNFQAPDPTVGGVEQGKLQQPIHSPPAPTPILSPAPAESKPPEHSKEGDTLPTVNIQVGGKSFTATLYPNNSTRALLEKLPLTLNMDELNGNEKFYFFSESFPADSERVGTIKTGDLMLYGSDCLVLFYESFSTSYSYTRLGYMEDAAGLAEALGGGSVEVTFSAGG